jgi:serine/threonine protein kinase
MLYYAGYKPSKEVGERMANRIGEQLGNYRLTRLLGSGGFAEVYLGEHVHLGTQAAIKVLYAHLAQDQINDFRQEARMIAELKQAHIVRVLDFDVQNGMPFLVLDYAAKGSLQMVHPRGCKLPLDLVVTYVEQIASALQYAHDRKLIHRDVKPENILLGDEDELLLSDFGIATIAHATSSMNTQASMGTLAYMAPEQIQGKPRKESDQYALAVMVYRWLTGELPFVGSSAEIIAQHIGVPPAPLRTQIPELPEEVEQVVLTALAKDPAQRFSNVKAFARALASASGNTSTSTSPSPLRVAPTQPSTAAPAATTQQASPANEASPQPQRKTEPARPALKLTSPGKQLQTQDDGRGWIKPFLLVILALVVIIGGTLWWVGNGSELFPYHLSASTMWQTINIPLEIDRASGNKKVCPIPTITSWRYDDQIGQVQIHFDWQNFSPSISINNDIYTALYNQSDQLTYYRGFFQTTANPPADQYAIYGKVDATNRVIVIEPRETWVLSMQINSSQYCAYKDLYFQA